MAVLTPVKEAEDGQRRSFGRPIGDLPGQGEGVVQMLGGRSQLAPHPRNRAENGQRPGFGESVADGRPECIPPPWIDPERRPRRNHWRIHEKLHPPDG
jgi:hypothetical protein